LFFIVVNLLKSYLKGLLREGFYMAAIDYSQMKEPHLSYVVMHTIRH